GSHGHHHH
nr:Chain N, GLY-SER-HIS-GLY-HIS-HIS-HIS-HIS [Homo sapiens]